MRKSLETLNLIREYTVIPALDRLGFEMIAFSFVSGSVSQQENVKASLAWVSENPKIIFSCLGEGLGGKTLLLVSIHKSFSAFSEFSHDLRGALGARAVSIESFLVSLKSDVVKHFSFRDLERI